MPKGYWIARVDVHDVDRYALYVRDNAAALARFGGRPLVRGGAFENPEGEARARNVVIEFPSKQAALDCWHSPEYQAARAHRLGIADFDLVIIEGVVAPPAP